MNAASAPAGASVFAAALAWLQGTLLGTVATSVAVVAVASVGFLMLSGRIDVRRGAQVVLGCFVLFGAPSIAAGIIAMAHHGNEAAEVLPSIPQPLVYAPPAKPSVRAVPYDPYAGAALPTRR